MRAARTGGGTIRTWKEGAPGWIRVVLIDEWRGQDDVIAHVSDCLTYGHGAPPTTSSTASTSPPFTAPSWLKSASGRQ
ncbi:MAG: hypothetical protein HBSAPP03_10580 [Phycisphaerae bacterium]|nr:MAG: hypothetical protein HBSAPP03_10580 [Phycisphaerae bacterium]